jgi:sugar (pentulose or hexulose) kinase
VRGPLLLGLDVGTTFCKAGVVTREGAEVAHGTEPTPWRRVATGAEVDPYLLLEAALRAARRALAAGPDGKIAAIAIASMAETGVLLDGHREPVAPAIAWHDSRGREEATELATDLGAERFTEHTGLPATPLCSLVKYRWLRANHPRAKAGRRWLSIAEWMVHALGGEEVAEPSLASRTGFLDVASGGWWDEALAWADSPNTLLPDTVPAGTAAGRASGDRFPEAAGAILTVAGHDHLAAAVGAGATREGDVFDSCGTAEAFVRAVQPLVSADRVGRAVAGGVTVGWHVLRDRQALLGGFLTGLQRFLDLLGVYEEARARLDAAALEVPEGAGGLTVSDITAPAATLAGIRWGVSPAAVWRASLEAVARQGAGVLETIESVSGPTERLVVAGGWARSPAFCAVKEAAVGGFDRPPVIEAGARGAALLGGCAAGLYRGVDDLPELESSPSG